MDWGNSPKPVPLFLSCLLYTSYGWLPVIPTQQMANGELDDFHKSYFAEVAAQEVRDMGPIWFRPANEMNGSWTPYYGEPTNYGKAWRRMYNIAEQLGVDVYKRQH